MASLARLARADRLRSAFEVRLLRASIFATLAIALVGIVLGILADSVAILFDGLFSRITGAVRIAFVAAMGMRGGSIVFTSDPAQRSPARAGTRRPPGRAQAPATAAPR